MPRAYARAARATRASRLPGRAGAVEPVWHLYVDPRRASATACGARSRERGIQTGIHYPVPVHLQAAYADLGHGAGSFPVSEEHAGEILSLPMYPELDRRARGVRGRRASGSMRARTAQPPVSAAGGART